MVDDLEPKQFDSEAWLERLHALNPWVRANNLTLPGTEDFDEFGHSTGPDFRAALRAECMRRFQAGKADWNAWAEEMLVLKAELEAAGLWRTGRRDRPVGDELVNLLQGDRAESAAFVALSQGDFQAIEFAEDASFEEFAFPGDARFEGAAFSGPARFNEAAFSGDARFEGAAFSGPARFNKAAFSGPARFNEAAFSGDAEFGVAAFSGDAWFDKAAFSGDASFGGAAFSGDASFGGAAFSGDAWFYEAAFSRDAWFDKAAFSGAAVFYEAAFTGDAGFEGAAFSGAARFRGAAFSGEAVFDETAFSGDAWFDKAAFTGDAQFHEAAFSGAAGFEGAAFSGDAVFNEAAFSGNAWFHETAFSGDAWFHEAAFTGNASFHEAAFTGAAVFREAAFSGAAVFREAAFTGNASFHEAAFTEAARFDGVAFTGAARFGGAAFSKDAGFDLAQFNGATSFRGAHFQGPASFNATQGKEGSSFTLADATFDQVPDFIQAHFQKAPRLDNVKVGVGKLKRDEDMAARWRALRGLAIDAHDHEREMDFFAGEVKAQRGVADFPFPWWRPFPLRIGKGFPWLHRRKLKDKRGEETNQMASFWPSWGNVGQYYVGWLFQIFSDFSRSMFRPLLIWAGLVLLFAAINLSAHFEERRSLGLETTSMAELEWISEGLPKLDCIAGRGDARWEALYLSGVKGLVFTGLVGGARAPQTYACLYGLYDVPLDERTYDRETLPPNFTPVVPPSVSYYGVGQLLLSLTLITLFLLAVRNHFRIR